MIGRRPAKLIRRSRRTEPGPAGLPGSRSWIGQADPSNGFTWSSSAPRGPRRWNHCPARFPVPAGRRLADHPANPPLGVVPLNLADRHERPAGVEEVLVHRAPGDVRPEPLHGQRVRAPRELRPVPVRSRHPTDGYRRGSLLREDDEGIDGYPPEKGPGLPDVVRPSPLTGPRVRLVVEGVQLLPGLALRRIPEFRSPDGADPVFEERDEIVVGRSCNLRPATPSVWNPCPPSTRSATA